MDIEKFFKNSGLKIRESQIEMIQAVKNSILENKNLVIEAPTATGKSFAYLIGALLARKEMLLAEEDKPTVIISTATVSLQEQLIHKDLPFINGLLKQYDMEFSFKLAKGRSRYLCIRKLHAVSSFNKDLYAEANLLSEKIQAKWDGDFDNLDEPVSADLIKEIYNTSASCSFSRCEYHKDCPFLNARKGLRKNDVIVTNHNLLISHLSLGDGAILPQFKDSIYIIDECHHLPDTALQSLAAYTSLLASQSWINDVDKVLNALPRKLDDNKRRQNWSDTRKGLISNLRALQGYIHEQYTKAHKEDDIWRIKSISDEYIAVIQEIKSAAEFYVTNCEDIKKALYEYAQAQDATTNAKLEKVFTQIGFLVERSYNFLTVWTLILNQDKHPPVAKWVLPHKNIDLNQIGKDYGLNFDNLCDYEIHASPVEVASSLNRLFWSQAKNSVILCSATVRSMGNFDRFLKAAGLKNNAESLLLASPLAYEKSSLIIHDMQYNPTDKNEHLAEVIDVLNNIYLKDVTEGVLVLFTSIKSMLDTRDKLKTTIKKHVIVQGDKPKYKILEHHKKLIDKGKPSIIFGVNSFSEGVDLPGKYLTRLIIHKLPFSVPINPIDKTRAEWLESINRNPFIEISLPHASLRLTQMIGRLIRSEDDSGEVIILDKRLKTKFYGKQLISGLPAFKIN